MALNILLTVTFQRVRFKEKRIYILALVSNCFTFMSWFAQHRQPRIVTLSTRKGASIVLFQSLLDQRCHVLFPTVVRWELEGWNSIIARASDVTSIRP